MLDEALRVLVAGAVADAVAPLEREMRALHAAVRAGASRWVSRREAAEALGVSPDTIDRRLRDGSLRVQRMGRTVRVLLEPPPTEDKIGELAREARTSS